MEVVVKINEERIYVVCNPAHWLKRINVQVSNPAHWLERINVEEYQEPVVHATIITPVEYLSPLLGNAKKTYFMEF